MENTTQLQVQRIITNQKKFFASHTTKSTDFRIEQLKKLKAVIAKYEVEISEALYSDLRKSKQ